MGVVPGWVSLGLSPDTFNSTSLRLKLPLKPSIILFYVPSAVPRTDKVVARAVGRAGETGQVGGHYCLWVLVSALTRKCQLESEGFFALGTRALTVLWWGISLFLCTLFASDTFESALPLYCLAFLWWLAECMLVYLTSLFLYSHALGLAQTDEIEKTRKYHIQLCVLEAAGE